MTTTRRFFITGAGDFATVISVLQSRVGLSLVSDEKLERHWLDTNGQLLQQQSMLLEYARPEHNDAAAALRWTDAQRSIATNDFVSRQEPTGGSDLPEDAAWDRLRTLLGNENLTISLSTATRRASFRHLNDDEKTTVRVVIDESSLLNGAALPVRLEITELRGYGDEADEIERKVHQHVALRPTGQTAFDTAQEFTTAKHVEPLGYRVLSANDAETKSAAEGWHLVLRALGGAIFDEVKGIEARDVEALHRFRVAVRRMRTILQDGNDVIDKSARKKFRTEFQWLGEISTPARDADVLYELVQTSALASEPVVDQVHSWRENQWDAFLLETRLERWKSLQKSWDEFLTDSKLWRSDVPEDARKPLRKVASKRILSSYERLCTEGAAINKKSPAEDLHELRKTAKRLRYLLESFGPLFPDDEVEAISKPLRHLQKVLGEFQDGDIQAEQLLQLAGAAAIPLAEEAKNRCAQARREFADAFAKIEKRSVRRAVKSLDGKGRKS